MKNIVTRFLLSLGLSPHYKGFQYLVYAIKAVIEDNTLLANVNRRVYPAVGEVFGISGRNVERCIRTAVHICWNEGNKEMLANVFGQHQVSCPSNSKFIAVIAQYISLSLEDNNQMPLPS